MCCALPLIGSGTRNIGIYLQQCVKGWVSWWLTEWRRVYVVRYETTYTLSVGDNERRNTYLHANLTCVKI